MSLIPSKVDTKVHHYEFSRLLLSAEFKTLHAAAAETEVMETFVSSTLSRSTDLSTDPGLKSHLITFP
jgi:hypothetical protein